MQEFIRELNQLVTDHWVKSGQTLQQMQKVHFRPERPGHVSPGQRPGYPIQHEPNALKGQRNNALP